MGIEHKKFVGTYMGDQENKEKVSKSTAANISYKDSQAGSVPKGLPNQKDDFPKQGKDIAPSFQMLREQEPSKGKI